MSGVTADLRPQCQMDTAQVNGVRRRLPPSAGTDGLQGDASTQVSDRRRLEDDLPTSSSAASPDPAATVSSKESEEEEEVVEEVEDKRDNILRLIHIPQQAHQAMERVEEFVCKVWEGRWPVLSHDLLPDWLKDNDYLLHGHRPPMPSFRACFRSIFRIHTETGNIWTHLIGFLLFLILGTIYLLRPNIAFIAPLQEKVVFGTFFLGAILCLCFSWLFHTVYCHSESVSKIFSKLDYSGIALLIMGSFVPWLYYSFYCSPQPRIIYMVTTSVLGVAAIVVSQWDRFATPEYRAVRAGVFLGLGLSGIVPTIHFMIAEGFIKAATVGQIGWLFLMAVLYITGAALYAARIPERFFPGKCDIWLSLNSVAKYGELSPKIDTVVGRQCSSSGLTKGFPLAPNIPRPGGGGGLRALPRRVEPAGVPLYAGRGLF
ncbi:adiponectin receptor protein 1-like isoform X1 [Petromyzon marinus]|uniref:Adiponectin receptor protein 1-like isoform X2 n=1 Tax=Petromyzon marinus TaxID=7757 RepID=A0AAJ7X412_PETMA|nr:adiponectin receptor protein 1-like isoform X2 [Petromyzon marinus]